MGNKRMESHSLWISKQLHFCRILLLQILIEFIWFAILTKSKKNLRIAPKLYFSVHPRFNTMTNLQPKLKVIIDLAHRTYQNLLNKPELIQRTCQRQLLNILNHEIIRSQTCCSSDRLWNFLEFCYHKCTTIESTYFHSNLYENKEKDISTKRHITLSLKQQMGTEAHYTILMFTIYIPFILFYLFTFIYLFLGGGRGSWTSEETYSINWNKY